MGFVFPLFPSPPPPPHTHTHPFFFLLLWCTDHGKRLVAFCFAVCHPATSVSGLGVCVHSKMVAISEVGLPALPLYMPGRSSYANPIGMRTDPTGNFFFLNFFVFLPPSSSFLCSLAFATYIRVVALGLIVYGHITLKAPVLVRSPKLTNVEPRQYLDG